MSIHATVVIRCDKCGDSRADYTPALLARVCDALAIAERKAASQGWDVERVWHLCPTCVREKQHGPTQWTKEADPEDVMRLAVGHEPEEVEG